MKEVEKLFPLLVPVLPQTLLALVGSHLMSFPFLSARHNFYSLLHVGFHLADKSLSRLKSRNGMLGNNDGGILGDVTGSFLGPFLHDEASKTSQVDILSIAE